MPAAIPVIPRFEITMPSAAIVFFLTLYQPSYRASVSIASTATSRMRSMMRERARRQPWHGAARHAAGGVKSPGRRDSIHNRVMGSGTGHEGHRNEENRASPAPRQLPASIAGVGMITGMGDKKVRKKISSYYDCWQIDLPHANEDWSWVDLFFLRYVFAAGSPGKYR